MSKAVEVVESLARQTMAEAEARRRARREAQISAELAPTIAEWLARCNYLYDRVRQLKDHLPATTNAVDPDADFAADPVIAASRTQGIVAALRRAEGAYKRLGFSGHPHYVPLEHIVLNRAIEAEEAILIWMERVIRLRGAL